MLCSITKSNFVRLLTNCGSIVVRNHKISMHFFKRPSGVRNDCIKTDHSIRKKSIFRIFAKESVEKIKEKDNVPDVFQLIYRNRMSNYLLAAQIFSTVFAGSVCFGLIISHEVHDIDLKDKEWVTKPESLNQEIFIYLTVFITLCVLMQLMIRRMPLRIYNYPKQDEYIMIFYGALPTATKRITCRVNELSKLTEGEFLPWRKNTYEIKNKAKIILIDHYFRTPADCNIMLGYQKKPQDDEE